MKQLATLLLVLVLVIVGRAATVQVKGSYGDVIGTATFTWQASGTNTAVFEVICQGNTGGVKLQLSTSGGTPGNFTGSGGLEPGQYTSFNKGVLVWARGNSRNIDQGPDIYGPFTIGVDGSGGESGPPQYAVTFNIPANPSDKLVRYEVRQGGVTVGSYTAGAGSSGGPRTFPGLNSNTPVDLLEVHPTLVQKPDGSFEFNSSGAGGYERVVATGVSPTVSTSTPPTTPVTPIDQPTSGGAAPAPTGGGTNTANAPVWQPKGNVSGGTAGGQSTSDFTISSYREGVDKLYDAGKQNTASVVSAIQQASASQSTRDTTTNDRLATINTSVTGLGGKLDTLNTTATGIRTAVDSVKTSTDGVKTSVDAVKAAIESQTNAPLKLVSDPGQYDANWRASQLASAQTAAGNSANAYTGAKVTGNAVNVQGSSYSATTLGEVSVAGEQIAFSLSADDMGAAASGFSIFTACRGLLLLAACIGFIYSCSDTVNVYVASLGNSGGGGQALGGIETAVPGVVQAKHLASSSAIALAVMAGAAAIIAFVDTVAGRYGVGLGALLDSLDLGPIGPAYGFLDQFMPIAALTALAVLRAAFPYFVAPVYLAAANLARFAHI